MAVISVLASCDGSDSATRWEAPNQEESEPVEPAEWREQITNADDVAHGT